MIFGDPDSTRFTLRTMVTRLESQSMTQDSIPSVYLQISEPLMGKPNLFAHKEMSICASVKIKIGEHFLFCLSGRVMLHFRDDHYPVCRLDIRQVSDFATGSGYPKTAFKWEPDPDIRNAFIDISRLQTFGKTCALHNHSFIIFRSIFSAFCAITPSLSTV